MQKRISLKDIAAATGVSTALVSYVLNNKKEGRINKMVAERIRAMAVKMNYRTNQIARSLKTSRTYTIGLVLADISNPFSAALARYIEDAADQECYTVVFGSSDENPIKYKKILDALLNRQTDGLILSPPENSELLIKSLQNQVPFVLIDRYFPTLPTNQVLLDNYGAAYEATRHLINGGYKQIGMINYDSALVHLAERSRGFTTALAEAGLPPAPGRLQLVHATALREETELAMKTLLNKAAPADAVIFGSNIIAMHAVKYLKENGIRVPGQAALVTFDETDAFDLFYAPLTAIRQPIRKMAGEAVRILLANIEKENLPVEQVTYPGKLIIRASSAPMGQ